MLSKILRLVIVVIKAILDSELELGAGRGVQKRALVQGKVSSFLSSQFDAGSGPHPGELIALILQLSDLLVKIFNLLGVFETGGVAQPQLE